jgi:AcrR family transcriptional regulator
LTLLAGIAMVASCNEGARAMKNRVAPPRLGRREQNRVDKRDRIQRAGWDLFTTVGYDETTRAVAERADVAVGTLCLSAEDKRDLLCLVMHDALAQVTDARFASMPDDAPLIDQLMHLFSGLFAMYGAHPGIAAAFIQHFPSARGPNGIAVLELTMHAVSRIAQLVVTKQERGEVAAGIDAFQAATNLFSLYFGVLITWISGLAPLEGPHGGILRGALELQMRGLRP